MVFAPRRRDGRAAVVALVAELLRVQGAQLGRPVPQHRAVDLGEPHPHQDLHGRRGHQVVDHRGARRLGHVHRTGHAVGVLHRARHGHGVAAGRDLDVLVRHELLEEPLQAGRVGRHLDRVHPHLAGVVPDQERGGAEPLAVDQDLGRGEHRGLGDGRVAHGEAGQRHRIDQQRRGAAGHRDDPLRLVDHPLRPEPAGKESKKDKGRPYEPKSRHGIPMR